MSKEMTVARAMDILSAAIDELDDEETSKLATDAQNFLRTVLVGVSGTTEPAAWDWTFVDEPGAGKWNRCRDDHEIKYMRSRPERYKLRALYTMDTQQVMS